MRARLDVALVGLLLLATLVGDSGGTIWVVQHDPEDPVDLVYRAVQLATSGDTILVEPGSYYENIPISGKDLVFLSTGGSRVTILDGGRPREGRSGAILYSTSDPPSELVIDGFTLQNGLGAPDEVGQPAGGAVCWWSSLYGGGGSLDIRDVAFLNNSAGPGPNGFGGAVYATMLHGLRIAGCIFEGNEAYAFGSSIYTEAIGGDPLIEDCTFSLHGGQGLYLKGEGWGCYVVRRCLFESDASSAEGEGLRTAATCVRLLDNTFVDPAAVLATRVRIYDDLHVGDPWFTIRVEGNVFWRQGGEDLADPTVSISVGRGFAEVRGNTMMGVGLHGSITRGQGMLLQNNIVSHGRVALFCAAGGTARCNDIWPEHDFDPWDTFVLEENIALDPLFCDPHAGDFTIHSDSPCAPFSEPNADCDLIGALPVGCEAPIAVERTTWGRIKSSFR